MGGQQRRDAEIHESGHYLVAGRDAFPVASVTPTYLHHRDVLSRRLTAASVARHPEPTSVHGLNYALRKSHADVSSKSPRRHYKDPTCDRQPHRLSGTRPHSRARFHKYVSGDFGVGQKTRRPFPFFLPSFTKSRVHDRLCRSTLSSSLEICSTRTSHPGTVFTKPSRFCGSTR